MGVCCEGEDGGLVKGCVECGVGVPGQKVDQGGLGQRLWTKTVRHVN